MQPNQSQAQQRGRQGRWGGGGVPAVNVNLDTTALAATQAALLTSVSALNTLLLVTDYEKKEKKSILHGMAPNPTYHD
jgi:hypothetical protein